MALNFFMPFDFFLFFGGILIIVIIAIYGDRFTYGFIPVEDPEKFTVESFFIKYVQDFHVFILLGLAFWMSSVYRAGLSAVGTSLALAVFSFFWGSIMISVFFGVFDGSLGDVDIVPLRLFSFELSVASVLVSYGAVVGRVTGAQALLMAFFQLIFYAINFALSRTSIGANEFGGGLSAFTFGSVYGLVCATVVHLRAPRRNGLRLTSQVSDLSAMLGTLIMIAFWPSVNSAITGSTDPSYVVATVGRREQHAAINTYLALSSSIITTAWLQFILKGKFNMRTLQSAALSGGIAMGSVAGFVVQPYGALLIGAISAIFSTLMQHFLRPKLTHLYDSCDVLSTFLIPGVAGGLASVIATGALAEEHHIYLGISNDKNPILGERSRSEQAGWQFLLLVTSTLLPIIPAALTGLIMSFLPTLPTYYDDVEEFKGKPLLE